MRPPGFEPYRRPPIRMPTWVPSGVNSALPFPDLCTWEGHFASPPHGWSTIQDQINAGYPIYAQPGKTSGSYTETLDYGVLFSSVIVNIDWSLEVVALPDIQINISWEFSADLISWSAIQYGRSAFGINVRYIRLKLTFATTDDHSLAWLSNLQIFLDVKHEIDSGRVNVVATDINGTFVTFTKAFKDIDSITLTVESIVPLTAVYSFADIPNPVGFYAFVFDSTGARTTFPVSWKARGIV